jgi:hypothetical protein
MRQVVNKKKQERREGGREGGTYLVDVLEEFSHLEAVGGTVGLLARARVDQQFIVPPNSFLKEEGREGGRSGGVVRMHACAQVDQQL